MRILNITNGDGAAGILKASTVPGDVLPWRDPMHHGPFPAGLSLEELRPVRARYLAGPEGNARTVERDLRLRDDHLKAAATYDRVVLWFEHDLLDQLQILQLLDWFAAAQPTDTELRIICIDQFPGMDRFRGIGELDPAQMFSLLDQSIAISDDMLKLAQMGWAAFRSNDPTALSAFIHTDLSCLPFLKAALLRHLEEFPFTTNGLNRTEQQILSLVAGGVHGPVELFLQNMDYETALYIGDWRTFSTIDRLCKADLLTAEPGAFWHPPASQGDQAAFRQQQLTLTDLGQEVRSDKVDAADKVTRDEWLGGVHIQSGQPSWAWDPETQKPVLRTL